MLLQALGKVSWMVWMAKLMPGTDSTLQTPIPVFSFLITRNISVFASEGPPPFSFATRSLLVYLFKYWRPYIVFLAVLTIGVSPSMGCLTAKSRGASDQIAEICISLLSIRPHYRYFSTCQTSDFLLRVARLHRN